jgi:hypothetical protein
MDKQHANTFPTSASPSPLFRSSTMDSFASTASCSSQGFDEAEQDSISQSPQKRMKEEYLVEGIDYHAYLPNVDHPSFEHVRQLKTDRFKSGEKICNFVCLLCLSNKNKGGSSFFVSGSFQSEKKLGRASNFTVHLKRVHGIAEASSSTLIVAPSKTEEAAFQEAVADYITNHCCILATVENKWFKQMFSACFCKFRLPGRRLLENLCDARYAELLACIRQELNELSDIPRNADNSILPLITVFSDSMTSNSDHLLGFGISYISSTWEYREAPLFLETNLMDSTSANVARIITERFERELGITSASVAMVISDTATSALAIGPELINETSNKCMMHLLGLAVGHLVGTKYVTVNNNRVYFDVGKIIVSRVNFIAAYFKVATRLGDLKEHMKSWGLNIRCRPRQAVETRPSSCIQMLRHFIKISPAYQDFMTKVSTLKGYEKLEEEWS